MSKPIIAIPADIRELDGATWHAVQHQYIRATTNAAGLMPADQCRRSKAASTPTPSSIESMASWCRARRATSTHRSMAWMPARATASSTRRPRRDLAAAYPPRHRKGDPDARHLPRHSGAQCRARRIACERDPGAARHAGITASHRASIATRCIQIRQSVFVKEGSCIAGVIGPGEVRVNSLHRQAISEMAPRLQVEAIAEDGTIEAVSVIDAKAFAVGVQWHPEYWAETDSAVAQAFVAFGDAVRGYAGRAKARRVARSPEAGDGRCLRFLTPKHLAASMTQIAERQPASISTISA